MLGCVGLGSAAPRGPAALPSSQTPALLQRSTGLLILFFHFMLTLLTPKFTENLLYIRACALLVGHRFANTEYCLKNAVVMQAVKTMPKGGSFAGWHDCWKR